MYKSCRSHKHGSSPKPSCVRCRALRCHHIVHIWCGGMVKSAPDVYRLRSTCITRAMQTPPCPGSLRITCIESLSAEFSQITHSSPPLHDPSLRLISTSSCLPLSQHSPSTQPFIPHHTSIWICETSRCLLKNKAIDTRQQKSTCSEKPNPDGKKGDGSR